MKQSKKPIEKSQEKILNDLPYELQCSYDKLIHVDDLRPNPDNPNEHSEIQVLRLAEIMKINRVRRPIRVSKRSGLMTVGHCELQSFRVNGWDYAPVDFQEYKNAAEEFSDMVADNALASYSKLNTSKINDVVTGFGDEYNTDSMGLVQYEIKPEEKQGGNNSKGSEDEESEIKVPKKPKTKPGQMFRLGDHRLLCGDCTDPEALQTLFKKEKASFSFTSPPYLDQREYGGDLNLDPKHLAKFLDIGKGYCSLFAVNLGIKRKSNQIIEYWQDYIQGAKAAKLKFLSWNVWNRGGASSIGLQNAMFPIAHEWVLIFGEKKEINKTVPKKASTLARQEYYKPDSDGKVTSKKRGPDGKLRPSNKGDMSNPLTKMNSVYNGAQHTAANQQYHPAMFPVHLPEEYIRACSDPYDFIYEPFCGSGTSIIAAEKTDRKCLALEIDPAYCDVIIQRWENFTGKKAQLLSGPKKVTRRKKKS